MSFLSSEAIYGAYTELFAGLSPEITLDKTGAWSTYNAHSIIQRTDLACFSHTLGPIRYAEEGHRARRESEKRRRHGARRRVLCMERGAGSNLFVMSPSLLRAVPSSQHMLFPTQALTATSVILVAFPWFLPSLYTVSSYSSSYSTLLHNLTFVILLTSPCKFIWCVVCVVYYDPGLE